MDSRLSATSPQTSALVPILDPNWYVIASSSSLPKSSHRRTNVSTKATPVWEHSELPSALHTVHVPPVGGELTASCILASATSPLAPMHRNLTFTVAPPTNWFEFGSILKSIWLNPNGVIEESMSRGWSNIHCTPPAESLHEPWSTSASTALRRGRVEGLCATIAADGIGSFTIVTIEVDLAGLLLDPDFLTVTSNM
eukprot:403669-Rhodomonas_salina.2